MEHVDAEYEVAFRHAQVKEDRKAAAKPACGGIMHEVGQGCADCREFAKDSE